MLLINLDPLDQYMDIEYKGNYWIIFWKTSNGLKTFRNTLDILEPWKFKWQKFLPVCRQKKSKSIIFQSIASIAFLIHHFESLPSSLIFFNHNFIGSMDLSDKNLWHYRIVIRKKWLKAILLVFYYFITNYHKLRSLKNNHLLFCSFCSSELWT